MKYMGHGRFKENRLAGSYQQNHVPRPSAPRKINLSVAMRSRAVRLPHCHHCIFSSSSLDSPAAVRRSSSQCSSAAHGALRIPFFLYSSSVASLAASPSKLGSLSLFRQRLGVSLSLSLPLSLPSLPLSFSLFFASLSLSLSLSSFFSDSRPLCYPWYLDDGLR